MYTGWSPLGWGLVLSDALIYLLTVLLLWCVASRPVIGWRLSGSISTQITDGCGVSQLLCFSCTQAITAADTVIAHVTHDDRSNILSASSRHGTKQRGGLYSLFRIKILAPVFVAERKSNIEAIFSVGAVIGKIFSWGLYPSDLIPTFLCLCSYSPISQHFWALNRTPNDDLNL